MKNNIFYKLENWVRRFLSHYPISYAIIGGIGVVLFWRGVWHTTDFIMLQVKALQLDPSTINLSNELWWDGPLSLIVGMIIMLVTGLFVSSFIGNEVIMSGLRGEKKFSEKTETEIRTELSAIADIKESLEELKAMVKK